MNPELLKDTQIVYSNNKSLLEQEFGIFVKDKISLKFLVKKKKVIEGNYSLRRFNKQTKTYQRSEVNDLEPNFDIYSYKNDRLDKQLVSNFLAKINNKEVKPEEESTFRIIETSIILSNEKIQEILNERDSENISLIKFYKKGCRSCNAMKPFYEDLKSTSNLIKNDPAHNSLKEYNIKNLENFKNLQIFRLNTENDVTLLHLNFSLVGLQCHIPHILS